MRLVEQEQRRLARETDREGETSLLPGRELGVPDRGKAIETELRECGRSGVATLGRAGCESKVFVHREVVVTARCVTNEGELTAV